MLLKTLLNEAKETKKEIVPFNGNIEKLTTDNDNFMKIIYTSDVLQLSLMSLEPKEDIGLETHNGDQFIRIESGTCKAVIDDNEFELNADDVIIIPSGSKHNITNTSESDKVKLYTIYSPPQHQEDEVKEKKDS